MFHSLGKKFSLTLEPRAQASLVFLLVDIEEPHREKYGIFYKA
jgi:hypothetical protein